MTLVPPDSLHTANSLPYRIAVLCYLYDTDGRILLLHRLKAPNAGMYSPVGGKLDFATGEGPHDCARREIEEETGIRINHADLHMAGIVSETAYEGKTHWLLFLFEVTRPIAHDEIAQMSFEEGTLEWVRPDDVTLLDIPETDRKIMWPLVQEHRRGFFMVHIDCRCRPIKWVVQESTRGLMNKSDYRSE